MPLTPTILQNEKELFALLATGDQEAFTQIFNYYEPRLFPFILKITHSPVAAEEIVQEIFIKLWLSREQLNHVENHSSFIFKIATNKALDHLRKLARQSALIKKVSMDIVTEENTTEETIELRQMQQLIHTAVQQLPAQQKKVYTLSRQAGLNNDQIAAELNLSASTVKNHLTEALRNIKEYLQKTPAASLLMIIMGMHNN